MAFLLCLPHQTLRPKTKHQNKYYLAFLHDWVEIYSAAADIASDYNRQVNTDPEYGDEVLFEEFRLAMMHLDSNLLLEQTKIVDHATGTIGSYTGTELSTNNAQKCLDNEKYMKHFGFLR